jgi:hypothetical protein
MGTPLRRTGRHPGTCVRRLHSWGRAFERVHTSERRSSGGASLGPGTEASAGEENRLKGGCSQDWLPHYAPQNQCDGGWLPEIMSAGASEVDIL